MSCLGRLLVVAIALSLSACATRGGIPRPFPGAALPPGATEYPPPVTQPEAPVAAAVVAHQSVVDVALGYRGVPYRFGGSDPAGFDCSGFVQYVFKQIGSVLPREVREQVRIGRKIDPEDVKPGDLLFFQTVSPGASHVALAIGGGEFVHAPNSSGVVRIERLTSSYWASRFLSARRVG